MSTQTSVVIVIVAILAIMAFLAARGGGPRVTQIDRTVRRKKDEGDEQ